jgi:C1A family cysteine protease
LLKDGIKSVLSEQYILDCSRNGGNSGCNGGFTHAALKYIANNGIVAAEDYPYSGRQGKCRALKMEKVDVDIGKVRYERLRGNEKKLKDIVANVGPVAIAIRAADDFLNYKSGIYNNPKCSRNLDHAMLLVGYGHDEKRKMDYWLIKNSWVRWTKIRFLFETWDMCIKKLKI